MTHPPKRLNLKGQLFAFISIVVLSSCSTPKYTYYFDHYDYNSGKKKKPSLEVAASQESQKVISPSAIDEKTIVASASENEMYVANPAPTISNAEAVARIKSMSREEKRSLKQEVKRIVKENKMNGNVEPNSTKYMENDAKLAAIFGGVGLVLLIIGGDFLYVIGAIALLIGLYFFIRWLMRQ